MQFFSGLRLGTARCAPSQFSNRSQFLFRASTRRFGFRGEHRKKPKMKVTTLYETPWKTYLALATFGLGVCGYPLVTHYLKKIYFPRVEIFRLYEKDVVGNSVITREIHTITSCGFNEKFPDVMSTQINAVHPSVVFIDKNWSQVLSICRQYQLPVDGLTRLAALANYCPADDDTDAVSETAEVRQQSEGSGAISTQSAKLASASGLPKKSDGIAVETEAVESGKSSQGWAIFEGVDKALNVHRGLDVVGTVRATLVFNKKVRCKDQSDLLQVSESNEKVVALIDIRHKRKLRRQLLDNGFVSLGVWKRCVH